MREWRLLFSLLLAAAVFAAGACAPHHHSGDDDNEATPDDDDNDNDDNNDNDDDNDASPTDDDDNDNDNDNDNDDGNNDDDLSAIDWVAVPGGTVYMGCVPEYRNCHADENPRHAVTIAPFQITKTDITQGEYAALAGANPSGFANCGAACPVETVAWQNAHDYCAALGARLPTEAEWEYAARAGSTTAFYNGDITQTPCSPVDPNLTKIAWYCGNAGDTMHEPGGKAANAWGLYDMLGNAAEWTWDWYQSDYGGDATDPAGAATGYFKVVRGAAIRFDGAGRTRSASRAVNTPDYRKQYIGVRLVRTLSAAEAAASPAAGPAPVAAPIPAPKPKAHASKDYPNSLPFTFTRPAAGTPLTSEQITAFTQTITGFWKSSNYLHWQLWTAHGMGAGNGYPDYGLHYDNLTMTKSGDPSDPLVTFAHNGTDDNLTIPTSKVFNNVMAYYLLTGDAAIGALVTKLSKGYVEEARCMLWTDQDPETAIYARAPFPEDNDFVEEGRRGHVDYSGVRHQQFDWNAQQIENHYNPDYGDMWVRSERSQDDVPHIMRTVPMLERVAQDGADAGVRAAAANALQTLQAFSRDIVDSGYYIRSKDDEGNQRVPVDNNNMVNDMSSFMNYAGLLPNCECDPKLAAAMISYSSALDLNCDNGIGWVYEIIATASHYYNYEFVRYFHLAALYNSLMAGQNDAALKLLQGLAERADYMMHSDPNRNTQSSWWADAAEFLVASAVTGLPLTNEEAQLVFTQYTAAANWYSTWPYWDPWDPSVPNGDVPQTPGGDPNATATTGWENMLFFLEYCYSPLLNPATAPLIDCDIVKDPTQWGTGGQ